MPHNSSFMLSYWFRPLSLICVSGSFGGGALLSVQGSGFDPRNSTVTICGEECEVDRNMSTSSRLYCHSPLNNGKFSFTWFHRDNSSCHLPFTVDINNTDRYIIHPSYLFIAILPLLWEAQLPFLSFLKPNIHSCKSQEHRAISAIPLIILIMLFVSDAFCVSSD